MITTNTIGFLWVHGELPPLAHATLRSFAANGHECALYSYDNPAVPKGCRLLDAREILPEEEIWHGRNGSLACFADFFRWKLMYEKGCFWADIDIFCLKLMPAFAPGSVLYKSSDTSECPFQGFYRLPQGHPALKQGIDWISSVSLKERSKFRYTAVMDHLCRYFKDSPEMRSALPGKQVSPVSWKQWKLLWTVPYQNLIPLLKDAWQVHMFGEMHRLEPLTSWHKDSLGAAFLEGRQLDI